MKEGSLQPLYIFLAPRGQLQSYLEQYVAFPYCFVSSHLLKWLPLEE